MKMTYIYGTDNPKNNAKQYRHAEKIFQQLDFFNWPFIAYIITKYMLSTCNKYSPDSLFHINQTENII